LWLAECGKGQALALRYNNDLRWPGTSPCPTVLLDKFFINIRRASLWGLPNVARDEPLPYVIMTCISKGQALALRWFFHKGN